MKYSELINTEEYCEGLRVGKVTDIVIDGEIQADFALSKTLRSEKFPFTKLHNKKVNG